MDQRKKVLIIDEGDNCLLLKSYLLRKNYEVDLTHALNTAFESIKEKVPDYIYLNVALCTHPENTIKNLKATAPHAQLLLNDRNKQDTHFKF